MSMDRLIERGVLPRLFLMLILILLLGLSPRFHQFDLEMRAAKKAMALENTQGSTEPQDSSSLLEASRHIAAAANYLPWRADLWELAGHISLQAGDAQEAVQFLERAAKSNCEIYLAPQCGLSLRGLVDLGDAYQQSGNLTAAIEYWQEAFKNNNSSTELADRLIKAYISQGGYPQAIYIMQALVTNRPEDAQLRYRLGLYTATQDPEAAIDSLNIAAKMEPALEAPVSKIRREMQRARLFEDSAYSLVSVGQALASLEEWELAEEAFRQATLTRPDYSEAWAYLGEARQHTGDSRNASDLGVKSVEDSLSYLEKALILDPKSLAAHTFMALYWERKIRYDKALQYMQSAVDLDAKNPVLRADLASLLAASGELDEAYKVYLLAASLSPFDPTYQKYLVEFSIRYDYHIETVAFPIARQLVIQYPDQPAYLDLMAQVLIQQGDLATAERFLVRALQMDDNYAPAHLHLGLVYILRENRQDAFLEFNRAISLDSDHVITDQAQRLLETYFP